MASAFSHIAIPVCLGWFIKTKRWPFRLIFLGMLLSVIPDLDVISFKLGIEYSSPFGHRGFTHSIFFCFILSSLLLPFSSFFKTSKKVMFVVCFLSLCSHFILDAFTTGGLGVAVFWPFENARYFAPWKVIEVSPVNPLQFFSSWGVRVIKSELVYVWAPLLGLTFLLKALKRG